MINDPSLITFSGRNIGQMTEKNRLQPEKTIMEREKGLAPAW